MQTLRPLASDARRDNAVYCLDILSGYWQPDSPRILSWNIPCEGRNIVGSSGALPKWIKRKYVKITEYRINNMLYGKCAVLGMSISKYRACDLRMTSSYFSIYYCHSWLKSIDLYFVLNIFIESSFIYICTVCMDQCLWNYLSNSDLSFHHGWLACKSFGYLSRVRAFAEWEWWGWWRWCWLNRRLRPVVYARNAATNVQVGNRKQKHFLQQVELY